MTPDIRATAVQLRTMLLNGYAMRGDRFGLGLAKRCAWEVGDVIAEIHGRSMAGAILDDVSNAVLVDQMPALQPAGTDQDEKVNIVLPAGMMVLKIPTTPAEGDALVKYAVSLRARVKLPRKAGKVVSKR